MLKRTIILTFWLATFVIDFANATDLPRLLGVIHSDTSHAFFGYTIVPIGDQNDDGYDDFVSWDARGQGYVFHGGTTIDTSRALVIDDSLNVPFRAVGDVNGDGYVDIVGYGKVNGLWKTQLYYGGPTMDGHRDAWFGLDTLYGVIAFARGYDINGNGTDDILARASTAKSVLLFELRNPPDTNPTLVIWPANLKDLRRTFGRSIATGDFNGDDTTDLLVSMDGDYVSGEPGHVYVYWGGRDFDTIPDVVFSRPGGFVSDGSEYFGWVIENVGDVNGDGWDDFFVGTGAAGDDTLNFVYFGGPSFDTLPDMVIPGRVTHARRAGDLNSDGYEDFLTSHVLPFDGGSDVKIYLGGPDFDSIPDVIIRDSDLPGFKAYFGRDISGIGDYNGDGKEDFAVSAEDNYYKGQIYIFSGWSGATDVDAGHEAELPTAFVLYQNFPNPFNPSTTISYALPHRMAIDLAVFNVLGQRVCTIRNGVVEAGTHSIIWAGTDSMSHPLSSGVYLIRLSSGGASITRKLLLLR